MLSRTGATDLTHLVPADELPVLLDAYNRGLVNVFYCALAMACGAFVAAWGLEWKSMTKKPVHAQGEAMS